MFPEIKQADNLEAKFNEICETAQNNISIAERLYSSLKPYYKRLFHEYTKTNEYANPEVGDSYATVTEYGMPEFKGSGDEWDFHWGGVIMKDGGDNVTLENFSVSVETVRNSKWKFEMYGTKDPKQSFHKRQINTGHHGNIATTVSVVTEGSEENREIMRVRDKINNLRVIERKLGVDQRAELLAAAVEYNELADKYQKDRITVYEIFGHPDRKFSKEDITSIPCEKKQYIPV